MSIQIPPTPTGTPAQTPKTELDLAYEKVFSGRLTIGQAVALLRKQSGLKQPEFAEHRGISLAALRQIEQGIGNPTVDTLNKVGSIFGVKVGFVPIREPR